jgi:hypothetical protein
MKLIFFTIFSLILSIGIISGIPVIHAGDSTMPSSKSNLDAAFTAATFVDKYKDVMLTGEKVSVVIKVEGESGNMDQAKRAKEIRYLQSYVLKFLSFSNAVNVISNQQTNEINAQIDSVWIPILEQRSDVISVTIVEIQKNSHANNTMSPKKQMKQGVHPEDVVCKKGLDLVIRTNGLPACVKPETAEKMQKIGMLLNFIKFTDFNSIDRSFQATEKEITTVPASSMSIVNFYITDHDLNIAHSGVEVVSTQGLFEFTINGISINGPKSMIETGPDTGQFYIKLELPDTINGKPLNQEDIVLIKYLDDSDYSGEKRVLVKSVPLTKTFAKVQTSGGSTRIGWEFTVRIYEPDANRDSKNEDKISLSELEYRGDGGIRVTLDNPRFDANSGYLVETGPNSNIFEVQIKIPRQIDGKTIHIGDEYEIRYIDKSTPSNTNEKIILKGRIG